MNEDDGSNVVEFLKGVGDKKVIHLTFNDIDVEKLKEFIASVGPDDYEIKQDALTMAIQMAHAPIKPEGDLIDVVAEAAKFYEFLKGEADVPEDAA